MVLYLLLKAEVRLKGYYVKPQSLSGMGRVHWSYRLPLLWTTVGGELWKAQARSVLSHQPQLLQDESRGMMVETWREGEYAASEESIIVYFWLLCFVFCFIFGCRAGPCVHTWKPFSRFLLYIEIWRCLLYLYFCDMALHFFHLISSRLQLQKGFDQNESHTFISPLCLY